MPLLDRWFTFAKYALPPPPFSNNVLGGAICDRWPWRETVDAVKLNFLQGGTYEKENFLQKYIARLHIYAEGDFYFMGRRLAAGVAQVAKNNFAMFSEQREDWDISFMAFVAIGEEPIALKLIGKAEMFWKPAIYTNDGARQSAWMEETKRLSSYIRNEAMRENARK
jgi:hypothetical protein